MKIDIHWKYADNDTDEILQYRQVLYAYTDNLGKEIIYIGKADSCSVKERLGGTHKKGVFKYLETSLNFKEYGISVGMFDLPENKRLSPKIISDVESLLIYALKPKANIQSVNSRTSRPGIEVICYGDWPHEYNHFIDEYVA